MKKKPTKKDIEVVVSNLIKHLQVIEQRTDALDNIFGMYIKYKKDKKSFQKYVEKQVNLVSDDKGK